MSHYESRWHCKEVLIRNENATQKQIREKELEVEIIQEQIKDLNKITNDTKKRLNEIMTE